MTNLSNLTTSQLKNILAIKEQIEALQNQIEAITSGGGEIPIPFTGEAPKKKRRLSAAHRRKLMKALAKARKMRWAKLKGNGKKKDWRSSPAVRAKLSAAAKARWAKVRAEGKKRL